MSAARTTLPELRRPQLSCLLRESRLLQAIECHDPLSAMLGDRAEAGSGTERRYFDLLWASGFSHATAMGLPDAGLAILERRLSMLADIAASTSKPILADGDTGGDAMALTYLCQRLEYLGVSGVIVEDKTGAKRTSLADDVSHELEDPVAFVDKIAFAKSRLRTDQFLIFARTESLIAGLNVSAALERARHYLCSPADGVVIHSKDRSGTEVLEFMRGYRQLQSELGIEKPLVCIPTVYNHMTGAELHANGARIVIHGNHMIRAAYRGMQLAAHSILENDRSFEAGGLCAPLNEVFECIGT